jgi:hypothetical protein
MYSAVTKLIPALCLTTSGRKISRGNHGSIGDLRVVASVGWWIVAGPISERDEISVFKTGPNE